MKSAEQYLKSLIESEVFVRGNTKEIVGADGSNSPWMFDFKKVTMQAEFLAAFTTLFFDRYQAQYPFQVGGLETGSIPLLVAITTEAGRRGLSVNSFFLRKSRKKSGTMSLVVGTISNAPIILVDDLLHSGRTFAGQIAFLQELKNRGDITAVVTDVFSILRFKNLEAYQSFTEQKIQVSSVFELNDFKETLGIQNLVETPPSAPVVTYAAAWRWQGRGAKLIPVQPKSDVLYAEGKVYFGTDTGHFMCLETDTGRQVWQYHIPLGSRTREAFSTPVRCRESVVVGSRDGTIYAFDRLSGKRLWVSFEADWIQGGLGASEELGYVFLPLSFGLFKKQGKVVAVQAGTGKTVWEHNLEAPLGGGITYYATKQQIFFGTEDGKFLALHAKTGAVLWSMQLAIKTRGCPALCPKTGLVIMTGVPLLATEDDRAYLYGLNQKSGQEVVLYQDFFFGSYGTPCVYKGYVFFTALDKYVYCIELKTGRQVWAFALGARSFASPAIITSSAGQVALCVGANNGRLYTLDLTTAKIIGITYLTERLVNNVAFLAEQGLLLVPTQANELYALKLSTIKAKSEG